MRRTYRFNLTIVVSTIAILLLAMLLVTSIVLNQYQTTMISQNERETLRSFITAENKINKVLKAVSVSVAEIKGMENVDYYLYNRFSLNAAAVKAGRAMLLSIEEGLVKNPEISGLLFIREDGKKAGILNNMHYTYEMEDNTTLSMLNDVTLPVNVNITWLGAYPMGQLSKYSSARNNAIMMVGAAKNRYTLSYSDTPKSLTTLVAIGENEFRECFDELADTGEEIYLLDAQGRQLLGPDAQQVGIVPWLFDDLEGGTRTEGITLTKDGSKYQIVFKTLNMNGWILVKTIPYAQYNSQINHLRTMAWVICTVILLLTASIYTIWCFHLTNPFREISIALENVKHGQLSASLQKPYSIYEFELIRTEFNKMIDSIQRLLEQTKTMERDRVTLELTSLQRQLNPHMVFNSITAIRYTAMLLGANKVSDMLVQLAALIRPVYSEWRLTWTLKEELEYVRHYMTLLQLRFGGTVHFEISLDEQFESIEIPCFSLQPIFENSAEHGFDGVHDLDIRLISEPTEDGVRLTVMDNGMGIPQEKLKRLRAKLFDENSDPEDDVSEIGYTGIGLANIHRRLRLFAGDKCGLVLESHEGQGTKVSLWLPV